MTVAALVNAKTQTVLIEIVLQRIQDVRSSWALISSDDEHNGGDQKQNDGCQYGDDDTDEMLFGFLIDGFRWYDCK